MSGCGREHARERGAPRLAAGEARGIFVAGQPELFEQIARAVRIVARRKAGLHIGERGGKARQVRLLRADSGSVAPGCAKRVPRSASTSSGGDLEQGRLARAVAADQAHALALADRQLGAFEQRRAAEGEVDVLQGEQRRGHARRLRRRRGRGQGPWHAACRRSGFGPFKTRSLDHETRNLRRACRRFHRRCAAHAQGTLRIAMTASDIPLTTGQTDQGGEGMRFMGYTVYDALINWDLSSATKPSGLVPGLATSWGLDEGDATQDQVDLQAARGREIPRRLGVHRRGRGLESRQDHQEGFAAVRSAPVGAGADAHSGGRRLPGDRQVHRSRSPPRRRTRRCPTRSPGS